jgi:hypothetical protein
MPAKRFCELSAARQDFVRLCQRMNFGRLVNFTVQDGNPILLPETELLAELKLDSDDTPRPEQHLKDFALPVEVVRLFAIMDTIRHGVVDYIELRAGIPRRITFKSRVRI